MNLIVDRFEEDFVILEIPGKRMIICPREILPENAKEGSILSITVDETSTNEHGVTK